MMSVRIHIFTPDSNQSQIKQGTKAELPLWLAEMLAVTQSASNTSALTLDLPYCLSSRVLNALKADPRTLDLRALAPHFYALGARMLELFEEDELVEVMSDVSICTFRIWCYDDLVLITFADIQETSKRDSRSSAQSSWSTWRRSRLSAGFG